MARNNKSSNSSSKNSSKNSNNNNNYNNNIIVVIINKKRKTFCTQWLTIPKQRKTYKNINLFLSPSHTKANRNLHKNHYLLKDIFSQKTHLYALIDFL